MWMLLKIVGATRVILTRSGASYYLPSIAALPGVLINGDITISAGESKVRYSGSA